MIEYLEVRPDKIIAVLWGGDNFNDLCEAFPKQDFRLVVSIIKSVDKEKYHSTKLIINYDHGLREKVVPVGDYVFVNPSSNEFGLLHASQDHIEHNFRRVTNANQD